MKIRSSSEVASLDDSIDIFQESDWKFLSVVNTDNVNSQYFNDMRDTDFDKSKLSINFTVIYFTVCISIVLITCITILIRSSGVFNNKDYDSVRSIGSDSSGNKVYETGNDVSSDELIECSKVLTSYVDCLRDGKDYNVLNSYCASGSNFFKVYNEFKNGIKNSYDENDCYSRALKLFGSYCNISRVNKVVEKDGVYYCYVDLILPSSEDMSEFIYMFSYDMTKFFNCNPVTQSNIIKFLLDSAETTSVPCNSREYCITLTKNDNNKLVIIDDSQFTVSCTNAYTGAISQMTVTLKGNLSTK